MSFFVGVDLGQVSEPTAVLVVESDTLEHVRTATIESEDSLTYQPIWRGRDGNETTEHPPVSYALRHVERISPGTGYPAIVERVKAVMGAVLHPTLAVDVTGVGTPVTELFSLGGLSPWLVQVVSGDAETQDGRVYRVSKKELVSMAQVLLQTRRLRIARGLALSKLLVKELSSFRMKVGLRQDEPAFWREGAADDLVLGLSIALWIAERHSGIGGAVSVGKSVFADGWGF